ncbi:hypothetical protein D515_03533 [Grimontia indica]|uniref:DUF4145 domain-containing protein n=1 Tax=Grimontia indica TaxID=1056512 RepID=R1IAH9_9GAMM|nr:hypothetical protein [Grimontia indica]EOD77771.1 hypothetical protein D515_03533 [Grimontia indica]
MKTKLFNIKYCGSSWKLPRNSEKKKSELLVPTLSAYAIEFSELRIFGFFEEGTHKTLTQDIDYFINGDSIFIDYFHPVHVTYIQLIVNYHGIREYELLFPKVTNLELKSRLAKFYQESEASFESQSWLCYSLMNAAIFEGMLISVIGKDCGFYNLIEMAKNKGYINSFESECIHNARNKRNLIHAGKFKADFITRAEAMDLRTVMDKLIYDLQVESRQGQTL